jgi:malonyl CoA-acyl carrier protein transacylase
MGGAMPLLALYSFIALEGTIVYIFCKREEGAMLSVIEIRFESARQSSRLQKLVLFVGLCLTLE